MATQDYRELQGSVGRVVVLPLLALLDFVVDASLLERMQAASIIQTVAWVWCL